MAQKLEEESRNLIEIYINIVECLNTAQETIKIWKSKIDVE